MIAAPTDTSTVRSFHTVVSSVGENLALQIFDKRQCLLFIVNFSNQHFFQAAAKRGFQLVYNYCIDQLDELAHPLMKYSN
jgi:hypothetical protein